MSTLVQLGRHVTRLRGCTDCPDMIGPSVSGGAVVSPVMLIGQAPGAKEGPAGKPFAWTAGKTMFGWFSSVGLAEEDFRSRVYMAAVCRCFPGKARPGGKAAGGGDRVPSPTEIKRCSRHLEAEIRILQPRLVVPVGKLAIAQLYPEIDKLTQIIGSVRRGSFAGHEFDVIALPHPSGASTWHRSEPGKTLLAHALAKLEKHEAWRTVAHVDEPATSRRPARRSSTVRA